MTTVPDEIHKIVKRLSPDRQEKVLEFAQKLTQSDQASMQLSLPTTPLPPGTPGSALLQLRFISSHTDIEAMERALEDCERIDVRLVIIRKMLDTKVATGL